ncbi:MAG: nucleotide sugar dehydrogenase [Candidatus Omnitrophica bacterium]|nr:nucleotide sugar dehydrogenase [Candidatus Omnitrophota bacterium]
MKKSKDEKSLFSKIKSKQAKIAVIGLGYVGLPLAHAFARQGYAVTGIDIDSKRIALLEKGQSYISDLKSRDIQRIIAHHKFKAVSDYDVLEAMDVVIVCVPTPLNRVKDPDISYIVSAANAIAKRLHGGELVILESTTYPGTTEEVILPCLEKSGLKVGKNFFLCFSPERIDPGNKKYHTGNIPKVVGGITPACRDLAAALYSNITSQVVKVSSSRTAEMAKLLENTFRIVNIGLVNELAKAAGHLKINIWEAIDAAKTKPFGFMPFYPGPGIGGHCIGVDPIYLSWKARLHGADLHFIELARRMNAEMPDYVVSQAVYHLNRHLGKAMSRSKVLLLGLSYKKDVADTRESPALDILEGLRRLGAFVQYHDPFVPSLKHNAMVLESQPLTPSLLRRQDLVMITTDHSAFNYRNIVRHTRLIFDTRNVLKAFQAPHIARL